MSNSSFAPCATHSARSCKDSIEAAKWLVVNERSGQKRIDKLDPNAELRVASACVLNLVMGVEESQPGAKER